MADFFAELGHEQERRAEEKREQVGLLLCPFAPAT
jgi:hypothetical protein